MYLNKRALALSLLALSSLECANLFNHPLRQRMAKSFTSLLQARRYGPQYRPLYHMPKRDMTGVEVVLAAETAGVVMGTTVSAPVAIVTGVAIAGGVCLGEVILTGESETAQKIGDAACEIGNKVAEIVEPVWPTEVSKEKYEEDQKLRDANEDAWSARMDAIQRGEIINRVYDTADKGSKSHDKGDKQKDDKGEKERKVNTHEDAYKAYEDVKETHRFDKSTKSWELKRGEEPFAPNTDRVQIDSTHWEFEGYKGKTHQGAIDPVTRDYYKESVIGRTISKSKK